MRSVVYTCDRCMDLGEHNFPVLVRDYGPEVEARHVDLCLNCLHELLDFLEPRAPKLPKAKPVCEMDLDKDCPYHPGEHH